MRKLVLILMVVGLIGSGGAALGQAHVCDPVDQSTEEVISGPLPILTQGVVLTYDSSFLCTDAPPQGTYMITVTVSSDANSSEAVTIESLEFARATPRPGGKEPEASATATGLPATILPGSSDSFDVSGDYELAQTDEGDKVNVHLVAHGHGVDSGTEFNLGINVHLRGPGAEE